ncbi:MAG: hypothetical protein QXL94_00105 [Candidatus Parvarchaeum sp.]
MAEKISREEIKELIEKLRIKKDPPVDYEALGQLAKNTQNSSPDNLAMLMAMMMSNNKGGNTMDKFMEVQMMLSTLKALQQFGQDDGQSNFKAIIDELQKQRKQDMDTIAQVLAKNKEDEKEERRHKEMMDVLTKALEIGKEKEPKQDPMGNLVIEMIKDRDKLNPLDIYDRVQKNTSEQYIKQMELEKAHAKEKQEMQDKFLTEFRQYVEDHSSNADTMAELSKATQTIDQFQNFAKKLGWVTPSKEEGTEDKLDWRFLLNRALDIATNVSGAVNKPKRNPSMIDYNAEANRLFAKYKDSVEKPDHTPISKEWLRQQLEANPNLEKDWDRALVEMTKQQPAQQKPAEVVPPVTEQSQSVPEVEIPQESVPPEVQQQAVAGQKPKQSQEENINIYGTSVEGS